MCSPRRAKVFRKLCGLKYGSPAAAKAPLKIARIGPALLQCLKKYDTTPRACRLHVQGKRDGFCSAACRAVRRAARRGRANPATVPPMRCPYDATRLSDNVRQIECPFSQLDGLALTAIERQGGARSQSVIATDLKFIGAPQTIALHRRWSTSCLGGRAGLSQPARRM